MTDEGTKQLAECRSLTGLWLANTAVTDAGLERLKAIPRLAEFGLASTAVTDAGLPHLTVMRSLQIVDLQNTLVSADGLRRLKAALPGCQIKPEPPAPAEPASDPTLILRDAKWVPIFSPEYFQTLREPERTAAVHPPDGLEVKFVQTPVPGYHFCNLDGLPKCRDVVLRARADFAS
ncbi:MAG: hypothetical protein U0746_14405 [Gemmataceae bacterium]